MNAQGSCYNGYTALAAAAEGGQSEVVRMLLDGGADVLATSGNKVWTAAQIASSRGQGQEDIAQVLQQREHDVSGPREPMLDSI